MKLDGGETDSTHNIAMLEATNKYRTRMKKVAPPPPPPGGASSDQRPPLSNGDLRRQSSHEAPPILRHHNHTHHPAMSTTPGEDCAFDELLEGRMELEVVLPDNKTVRMTVDRRTPMMDLLVHAATANKISPGGHVIRVVPKISREQQQEEEEPQHHHPRDVPYKPNTPVGSLDVSTVHIVPKPHPDIPIRRMPKLANQPFEQTFRLQVNLPRNQRMVLRVSPRITLSELKRQICSEKELDHSSHHLVHPAQPDTVLDLNSSLELYGCAEISLMSNSGLRDSIRSTSTHLIGYPRVEDEKKKKGILRLFSKKKKEATVETSNTNGGLGSRGVSPTRNMTISNRDSYQPKQSTKRKPAPAPPPPPPATLVEQPEQPPSPPLVIQSSSSISSKPESEISAKTDELGSTVSHSRHSSDSSGYHEPSVFSDCSQENKSPEASIVQGGGGGGLSTNNVLLCTPPKDVVPPDSLPLLSRQTTPVKEQQVSSLTNLKTVPCCSNTSIVSATRKRKAPQPPAPPVLQEVETPSSPEDLSPLTTNKPVVESQPEISSPPPPPPPSSESGLPADFDSASNEESVGQIEDEETPMTPLPSPAQTPETIRQEKEAITYLENVLKESETATKSPTHLSPELDKRVVANVATEEPSDEANLEIDKSNDERIVEEHDAMDAGVIEANASAVATPLVSVPRLESPPADDPSSYPAVITSTEDDVTNAETTEVSSAVPISSSLPTESESLPVDGDKTNEDTISTAKDNSATPSVPSNKDILSQTSEATVESSMQPDLQTHNFVSDFKEKPTEQNFPDKVEQGDNNIEVPVDADSQQNAIEKFSSEVELHIEAPSVKNEVMLDINAARDQVVSAEPDSGGDSSKEGVDTPKAQRKLVNFALGCYKRDTKDIYNEKQDVVEESKPIVETLTDREQPVKTDTSVLKSRRQAPDVKIVPFEERSKTDSIEPIHLSFKGQVQQRCTELSEICMLPLTGRSSSLYNLMPQKKSNEDILPKRSLETLPENLKRTQSDQNLSQDTSTAEEKLDFIQEQKRLHDEYLKLQAQFISWQKQLLNNQSLLQSEQIMPQLTLPALEQYKIQLEQLPEILQLNKDDVNSQNEPVEQLKTRSLPRQKSPSLSVKNPERPNTPVVCQVPKTEDTAVTTPPAQLVSAPDESSKGMSSLIVNHISRPEETVIYAQVNKQKKTNKGDHTRSNVNSLEPSNNIPSESPELPKKQLTDEDISKSQTLPRQKTQPISAFDVSRTMTLNRQTRPKSQVVSVTIGSWQQRHQETPDINSASVASSRSMFQSLENIPRTNSKPNLPTPTEVKKFKPLNSISDKKEPPIPDVVTAKVIIKKDGKDVVEDSVDQPENSGKVLAQQKTTTKVSKAVERQNQNSKVESPEIESHVIHSKPSKPLVLLSSMKDETRPPSIQVLKKWPLSNMNEKESPQKTGERSIWSELKASAKRPSGGTKERVTRAEVDLRKHRTQKNESSSKSPKNKDPEPSTSKLHISKVNINVENKIDSSKSSGASSKSKSSSSAGVSSDKQKKIFPSSKSETLNAELKDVLLKRASSIGCQDSSDGPVESNYAELSNGSSSSNNVQSKTVAVNGNSPPPPPPPPVSTMPTIPPAAPIPKSSQLLMGKRTKDSQTKVKTVNSQSKFESRKDPREELMLEIRGFGGRQALRKAPAATAGWNLKVYGTASSLKS